MKRYWLMGLAVCLTLNAMVLIWAEEDTPQYRISRKITGYKAQHPEHKKSWVERFSRIPEGPTASPQDSKETATTSPEATKPIPHPKAASKAPDPVSATPSEHHSHARKTAVTSPNPIEPISQPNAAIKPTDPVTARPPEDHSNIKKTAMTSPQPAEPISQPNAAINPSASLPTASPVATPTSTPGAPHLSPAPQSTATAPSPSSPLSIPISLKEALQKTPPVIHEAPPVKPQEQATPAPVKPSMTVASTSNTTSSNATTSNSTSNIATPKPAASEQSSKKNSSSAPNSTASLLEKDKEKDKKEALKHLDRASNLGMHGRLKEAYAEFEKALSLYPNLPDAHVGLSAIYGRLGKWPEAIASLEKALSTPNDFALPANRLNAQYNLSASYCMNGQAEQAHALFQNDLQNKHPGAPNLAKLLDSKCPVTSIK